MPQQRTLQPEHVQTLYQKPVPGYAAPDFEASQTVEMAAGETRRAVATSEDVAAQHAGTCDAIAAEIAFLDQGLGSKAVDKPPVVPPTTGQKTGNYFYNLGVQTVLGQLQAFIQTKRAIFDDDEKDRRVSESVERGTIRRAYLKGYAEASGCEAEEGTDNLTTAMQQPID